MCIISYLWVMMEGEMQAAGGILVLVGFVGFVWAHHHDNTEAEWVFSGMWLGGVVVGILASV